MPYRNQIPRFPQVLTLATSLRVATYVPKVLRPPIRKIEKSLYQCEGGLKDGTYMTWNIREISGSYKSSQTPWLGVSRKIIICTGHLSECSYQSSPCPSCDHSSSTIRPHILHAPKTALRPLIKKIQKSLIWCGQELRAGTIDSNFWWVTNFFVYQIANISNKELCRSKRNHCYHWVAKQGQFSPTIV